MATISFDLDGVLQRNPFQGGRPDGVFAHIGRALGPYTGQAEPEAAAREALQLVLQEHRARIGAGALVAAHDWDSIVGAVAERLGCPTRLDIAALVTEYCERPGLIYLYPGAAECLEALREQGHRLISITNGFRSYQEPVLRKLGILAHFDAVLTPDAVGAAKPYAEIFRAGERFGGPFVHVGDALPHDIAGARRAGWRSVYVVQPGAPGATPLPEELTALAPLERPAAASAWLAYRLERERPWHPYPPATLAECTPDAIVAHLSDVPAAITGLLG